MQAVHSHARRQVRCCLASPHTFCNNFTRYRNIIKAGQQFEIVFVSSDRSQSEADAYFKDMPWKALPFADRARKDALSQKFGVQGIPTLVLLDEHGNVITLDGRSALMSKPFPFK